MVAAFRDTICVLCSLFLWISVDGKALKTPASRAIENEVLDDGIFETWVIGGDNAVEPKPWMASLQFLDDWVEEYYHVCGAALVSSTKVVTAAHCVDVRVGGEGRGTPSRYRVMLAGLNLLYPSGNEVYLSVASITKHQDWMIDVAQGFPNDIAILTLSSPAPVSRADIYPIQLPSPSASFDGDICYIMGWGMTSSDNEIMPEVLQEAATPVIGHATCQQQLPYTVRDTHVCVGGSGQPLACSGDSGGPLVCIVGSSWQLVGIGSWSYTCDGPPSVYTSIPSYVSWINSHL